MKKQYPRKTMDKILRRRAKKNRKPAPKPMDFRDKAYEQTKKLAKKMGVRFLKDGETWRDIKREERKVV